ncbi:alpha/beta hydrolase [Nocardiopsis lambiniae]|uniref:Alpha/beta hydrolase n=1 Tax=Nocardiopsis lambiniae TaxID=3075539 RepID=A0ABU2M721_9ACTN|nr:alpha/beta hydrolase [Nocardiopsis sp. DSM 44743]MDT0328447.1 alpha/beta hydrolase [Nocardiopsis sp. DSM 44743]
MPPLHPELSRARFLPTPPVRRGTAGLLRWLTSKMRPGPAPEDMRVEHRTVPGPQGAPPVEVWIHRPKAVEGTAPALLWMHGGGHVMGHPAQDERGNIAFARDLGITVVAVRYRLAPRHPAPAGLEDAYAALNWIVDNAADLDVDPGRIAIGGASAGAGLAAGLALMCRDRGGPAPAFQLLVYPMLDDRTALRTDVDTTGMRLWSPASNRFAWGAYLGRPVGSEGISPYAAPARHEDLTGLPPAWIGVGTNDLFHDEDVAYARRLEEAGVPCALTIVPGAFHGFEVQFASTEVVRAFRREQTEALRAALFPQG